jgi:hypothetical protein
MLTGSILRVSLFPLYISRSLRVQLMSGFTVFFPLTYNYQFLFQIKLLKWDEGYKVFCQTRNRVGVQSFFPSFISKCFMSCNFHRNANYKCRRGIRVSRIEQVIALKFQLHHFLTEWPWLSFWWTSLWFPCLQSTSNCSQHDCGIWAS